MFVCPQYLHDGSIDLDVLIGGRGPVIRLEMRHLELHGWSLQYVLEWQTPLLARARIIVMIPSHAFTLIGTLTSRYFGACFNGSFFETKDLHSCSSGSRVLQRSSVSNCYRTPREFRDGSHSPDPDFLSALDLIDSMVNFWVVASCDNPLNQLC